MKNHNFLAAAIAVFVPSMLIASLPAHAASDLKMFSSNVCVPSGTAASNDLTYSTLGLLNTSTTTDRVVICPLVKDQDGEITAALPGTIYVEYKTANGQAGRVNCTLVVGSIASGNYTASSSETLQPANTTGEFTLSYQTEASWIYEPVNLACSLSARTRLTRIYADEPGSTNTP